MFGLNVYVQPDPVGTIDATKQDKYNIHHRRNDASLMIKENHTDNYFRQEGDIPSQIPHHYVISCKSKAFNLDCNLTIMNRN